MNREKTVVAYAGKIKFLGYGFYKGKKGLALRVHAKSKAKMKARVRELTSRRTVNDYEKWKVDLMLESTKKGQKGVRTFSWTKL